MPDKPEPMLWLDDHRGVYIPRDFATSFANRDKSVSGVDAEQWAILEHGPEGGLDSKDGPNEFYWDVWAEVCDHAVITDEFGRKYHVYQDGACWLIPDGMTWSETDGFFVWPEESEES